MDWSFPLKLKGLISTLVISDVLEILLVAVIFYKLYKIIEGTRAITLAKGIFVLFFLNFVCGTLFSLPLLSWLFEKIMTWTFVALPIVFQPELRRTLERLGEGKFLFEERPGSLEEEEAVKIIDEIVRATKSLSTTKTGALMVIERKMGLNDVGDTGIKLDAKITSELLLNIFFVNTPLHDGATIIRGKRIFSAACLLPLTEKKGLSKELGTRHRAALGLSEQCDALILIVSEETGTISVAENGKLMRHLNEETLTSLLKPAFVDTRRKHWFDFLTKWRSEK
ncbi:MAG: diadenylate cyclase CdaA [Selenomonadaceae bacterium]|nr:diadenylate cyclase CdaA [Selenomonadaceae bacterium]